MLKPVLPPLAALVLLAAVAPAHAQQNDRQLIIYGNDRCPEGTVCVRAPETERYRIPQTLRSGPLAPADQPWTSRAASVANAGAAAGTGSCSATGAGGWTGCMSQQMRQARAERSQDAAAAADSPAPR